MEARILALHWAVIQKVITTFPSVVNRRKHMYTTDANTHTLLNALSRVFFFRQIKHLTPHLLLALSLKGSKVKCGQLLTFDLLGLSSS